MKKYFIITWISLISLGGVVRAQDVASAVPSANIPQTTSTVTTESVTTEEGMTRQEKREARSEVKQLKDEAKVNGDPVVIYVSSGIILVLIIILLIILL